MTSKLETKEDAVAKGLIEKDGDTVRLIYALPDGQTPTEFKTGEKQLMFVMKVIRLANGRDCCRRSRQARCRTQVRSARRACLPLCAGRGAAGLRQRSDVP